MSRGGGVWLLSRSVRRALVLIHVMVSVGWMGAGATNLVLAGTALVDPDGTIPAVTAYATIHLIDLWLVIPAAFATLVSGVMLSVGTAWGLLRSWWVLIKFVLTIVVIVFSTFGVGLWVEQSMALDPSAIPSPHARALVIGATGNLLAFILMTALSVYKPRALTPWTTRPSAATASRR